MSLEEPFLLTTDTLQLHHVCLEERNAQREVYTHNPELSNAWEPAVNWIDEEDEDKIDMESAGGSDGERNVADLEGR